MGERAARLGRTVRGCAHPPARHHRVWQQEYGPAVQSGQLTLVAGAWMIPHVEKAEKGGEDAYFISGVGLGGVGVADGVSGWADEGIDPAEYPRKLMRHAAVAWEGARGEAAAADLIRYAQGRTALRGSSTICLALMRPGGVLETANVGDSGVRIIRRGTIVYGSDSQQHAFNMPFQLSHPSCVESPDTADLSDVVALQVEAGDTVQAGHGRFVRQYA